MEKYFTGDVIDKLRACYMHTEKPLQKGREIVVHIRRGDVTPHSPPDRFVPNEWYTGAIEFSKPKYPSTSIVIFPQGELADFMTLKEAHPDVDFELGFDLRVATTRWLPPRFF